MLIAILVAVCLVALLYFITRTPKPPVYDAQADWLKAGGTLGMLVMLARVTRLPLATLLTALPFVVAALKQQESRKTYYPPPAPSHHMSKEEARLILGLTAEATADDIKDAHRRLMQKNHPDTGGSDYLAAKINQARDVLLG